MKKQLQISEQTTLSSIKRKYDIYEKSFKAILQGMNPNQDLKDLTNLSRFLDAIENLILEALKEYNQDSCYKKTDLLYLIASFSEIVEKYVNICQSQITEDRLEHDNLYETYKTLLESHAIKWQKITHLLCKTPDLKEGANYLALNICRTCMTLGRIYTGLNQLGLALHAYSSIDDWLDYITPTINDKTAITHSDYQKFFNADATTTKKILILNKYYALYRSFRAQKYLSKAKHYLELAVKSCDIFDPTALEQIKDFAEFLYDQKKFYSSFQLFNLYCHYVDQRNHQCLKPESIKEYKRLVTIIRTEVFPLLKLEMLKKNWGFILNTAATQKLTSEKISHHLNLTDFSCLVTLQGEYNLRSFNFKSILNGFEHTIHNHNSFTIYNCYQYSPSQITGFIRALNRLTQDKPIIAPPLLCPSMSRLTIHETLLTSPITNNASDQAITKASSSLTSQRTKKGKESLATLKSKKSPPKKEMATPPLTTHSLGFHTPNDVKAYALGGNTIPKGIFYAYGIQLKNNTDRVTQHDLDHYQTILENGKIVPRGRQGLRVVRPEESGIEDITFKITDPAKDLRIVLELEEVLVDEKKHKTYLYRAGKAVFHRK